MSKVTSQQIEMSGMLDFVKYHAYWCYSSTCTERALRVCHKSRLGIAFIYLLGRDAKYQYKLD